MSSAESTVGRPLQKGGTVSEMLPVQSQAETEQADESGSADYIDWTKKSTKP